MSRFHITAAAFITVAALSATAQAQIELTTNGGFETGNTSGWTSFVNAPATFGVVSPGATGNFAGEINNAVQGTGQVVKQANIGVGIVTPGQQVTIRFDAKGTAANGGVAFAEFFSELSGGGTSSSVLLGNAPLSLTSSYQPFQFVVNAGPDVSGGVTLQLNAATGAVAGSTSLFTFDNISVSVVPEPATLGLIAAGSLLALRRRRSRRAFALIARSGVHPKHRRTCLSSASINSA
jgi:PEP-CTERM motif